MEFYFFFIICLCFSERKVNSMATGASSRWAFLVLSERRSGQNSLNTRIPDFPPKSKVDSLLVLILVDGRNKMFLELIAWKNFALLLIFLFMLMHDKYLQIQTCKVNYSDCGVLMVAVVEAHLRLAVLLIASVQAPEVLAGVGHRFVPQPVC